MWKRFLNWTSSINTNDFLKSIGNSKKTVDDFIKNYKNKIWDCWKLVPKKSVISDIIVDEFVEYFISITDEIIKNLFINTSSDFKKYLFPVINDNFCFLLLQLKWFQFSIIWNNIQHKYIWIKLHNLEESVEFQTYLKLQKFLYCIKKV